MADETAFRGVITFFGEIGIYDVVLPFLLIFTIVFAILEKTKVLGTEKIEGKEYTKKNIDSIVAFVIAFLVVASSRLVATINRAMANIVLLLLVSVCFLLLIGSFFKEGEGVFLEKGAWRTFFMVIMFIGVVLIFLHAIPTAAGESWLEWFWGYLSINWSANFVASVILIILVVIFIIWVTRSPKPTKVEKKEGG